MKFNFNKNKRGDVASIIYVVMFLIVIGIVVFFLVDLNSELFTEIENALNNTAGLNGTEAVAQATEFKETNQSRLWDYAFLGIFFGSLIAIGLSAYAVRISPAFYWIYGAISLFVLTMGVVLSNVWQDLATEPEFADTIANFPITNAMLGTYYPLIVTAIIVISMIILFGKPRGMEGT